MFIANKYIRFSRCFGICQIMFPNWFASVIFGGHFIAGGDFSPLIQFFFLRLKRICNKLYISQFHNIFYKLFNTVLFKYCERKWRNYVFVVRGNSPFLTGKWLKMAFLGNWPTPFSRHSQKKLFFAGQSHRSSHFCYVKRWNLLFFFARITKDHFCEGEMLSLRYKKRDLTMSRTEDIIRCGKRETQIKYIWIY